MLCCDVTYTCFSKNVLQKVQPANRDSQRQNISLHLG